MRRKNLTLKTLSIMLAASVMCSGCSLKLSEPKADSQSETEDTEETEINQGVSDENAVAITFSESSVSCESSNVTIEDNTVTITEAGTYELSGTCSDGRVVVDTDKDSEVVLILNGLNLTCSNYSPIVVKKAKSVNVNLADGSSNALADGSSYDTLDDEITADAVIFSKDDLVLSGTGALTINGNYKHGIVAKDDLNITGGTYTITAVEDGVNANDSITVDSGTFTINAGDDGMHVDETFVINEADIDIESSYEGLEGHTVTINDGTINIVASDDGINSNSGSSDSDSDTDSADADVEDDNTTVVSAAFGGFGGFGGGQGGGQGGGMMDTDSDSLIQINGGTVTVDAQGDGLDSNGQLEITGGTVYVSGSENDGNSAIDYGTSATISGGVVIATGYSGMAEQFDSSSTQVSLMYTTSNSCDKDSTVSITDADGNVLASWVSPKTYDCVFISTPDLTEDGTYTIACGDSTEEVTLSGMVNSVGTGSAGGMGGMSNPGNMDSGNMTKPDGTGDSGNMTKPDGTGDSGNMTKPDGTGNAGDMTPPDGTAPSGMPGNNSSTTESN